MTDYPRLIALAGPICALLVSCGSAEPPDARIATMSPQIVDKRIKTRGITHWVDAQTGHRLRLAFFRE
ncbi:MAG TPA: hypothetical protein VE046_11410 [Steroidobacteraceae bacterium]|nr:hypothetical protein [Steroidobacteraceae bacterium]